MTGSASANIRRAGMVVGIRLLPMIVMIGMSRPRILPALWAPLVLWTCWMVSEVWIEDRGANRDARPSGWDQGSRLAILGGHLASAYLPAAALVGGAASGEGWEFIVGLTVLGAGAILRLVAVATLGRLFTGHITVIAGQRLVCRGIFRHLRHPSYTGLFAINVGLAMALTSSPAVWVVVAIVSVATIGFRVRKEEGMLLRTLGDEYRAYRAATPGFLPIPFR